MTLNFLIVIFYSYFLGSIPSGLILTKIFLKEDIRKLGSGNIGATNVLRTGKKILAFFTLVFDVSKGYISVLISKIYFPEFLYLSALICFLGHIFPMWLNFKGGKGVATYLGVIMALSFKFAIIFGLIWLLILFISKYSSLSSIISSFSVVLSSFYIVENFNLSILLFILFIIIVFSHKENIYRLKNKTETKIKF